MHRAYATPQGGRRLIRLLHRELPSARLTHGHIWGAAVEASKSSEAACNMLWLNHNVHSNSGKGVVISPV